MSSKFDNNNLPRIHAEGRKTPSGTQTRSVSPTFVKMIIHDVVSDPNGGVDTVKKEYWRDTLNVVNIKYAGILPRNTIIASRVADVDPRPMFVFPFFPSHLAMPCKPGELVWVMFESPEAQFSDMAYWLCRVSGPQSVDDVNHSHAGDANEYSHTPGSFDRFNAEKSGKGQPETINELRNGVPARQETEKGTERITVPGSSFLPGMPPDVFELLLTETDAAALIDYEAVPRFRKRPGDLAFEGSNNTLIVLGTDRNGPIATYNPYPAADNQPNRSKVPSIPDNDWVGNAGSIDIVAGRGQTSDTFGQESVTTSILDSSIDTPGTELKRQVDKSPEKLSESEGDPDYRNDRSRILVSQRTSPDINFGLDSYNSSLHTTSGPLVDSSSGDAAVVIKSDKVRLIARSDIQLVVTNYTTIERDGRSSLVTDDSDIDNWASITIKVNGDIIFKPSKKGFIKLGGEDADKGLVCSDLPVIAADGNISGEPITTTMGGQFAGSVASPTDGDNKPFLANGQAKFANKVLVK